MLYIDDYDQVLENKIEDLYNYILEDYNTGDDSATAGGPPGSVSQKQMNRRYAVGGAIGAGIGTLGRFGLDKGLEKGKTLSKSSLLKALPFAIAGAVLASSLGVIYNIVKKKKKIKELISAEKDPVEKEKLKKELTKLSTSELSALKKYKKQEQLAKLKAKTKLSDIEQSEIKAEVTKAVQHAKKIDDLKTKIKEEK